MTVENIDGNEIAKLGRQFRDNFFFGWSTRTCSDIGDAKRVRGPRPLLPSPDAKGKFFPGSESSLTLLVNYLGKRCKS